MSLRLQLNHIRICRNQLLLKLCCFIPFAFLVACGQDKLDPLELNLMGLYSYTTVTADFCTTPPQEAQQKIKYLFIIDHSASNKAGIIEDPDIQAGDVQNTDANGNRRYGPMVNFVNNLISDANIQTYFGIIRFNDNASHPNGLVGFESDTATFVDAAREIWVGGGSAEDPSPVDAGFTNYVGALSLAAQMIEDDAEDEMLFNTNPVASTYQIVFVTDGAPRVANPTGTGLYTQEFEANIKPVINRLLDLKEKVSIKKAISKINLNTAYYFNSTTAPVPEAVTLLQQMADSGDGLFVPFASGKNVLYQQFALPSILLKNNLIDVFVENTNTVFSREGLLMRDSDGDGLSDLLELQMGSSINNPDSDGNGVSDFVEYLTKGAPCDDAPCDPLGAYPYAQCAGFKTNDLAPTAPVFKSSTNDGLNDCEKYLLNGSRTSFNSSGNFIPDLLAAKNSLSIQPQDGGAAKADPFGDGLTNYDKIKWGLPVQVSQRQLTDFERRHIEIQATNAASSSDVQCYQLRVEKVALSSNTDNIKIYVVQNPNSLKDEPFLLTAEKSLNSRGAVHFTTEDLK